MGLAFSIQAQLGIFNHKMSTRSIITRVKPFCSGTLVI